MTHIVCRLLAIGTAIAMCSGDPVTAADPQVSDKLPPGAVLQFGRPRFQSPTFGGHAAFSPDGMLLATWEQNTDEIAVWDLAAGKIVRVHKLMNSISLLDLRWRADGKLRALFYFGSAFLMWEWKDASDPGLSEARLQELAILAREKTDNFDYAFFLGDDHVGAVFFKSIGPPPTTLHYRLEVYKFAPNTISRLVNPEGTVKVGQGEWRAGRSLDGKVMFFFDNEKLNAYDWTAIAKGQERPLWSFETPGPGERDRRPHRCVSLDGKQVVVSFLGGDLELWDGPAGKRIRELPRAEVYSFHGTGESVGLALSPDGKRVAVMARTESGEAGGRIIDLATGKDVVTFTPHLCPSSRGSISAPMASGWRR